MKVESFNQVMIKALKCSFTACTLAYVLGLITLLIFFATLFRGSQEPIVDTEGLLSAFTLMLSDFSWWGDFVYLAFLVPWLASSCILTFLIYRFNGGAKRRALLTGLGVFVFYFAMCLVFLIYGLIRGWGDIAYGLIWIWPMYGFGLGYAAASIFEKVLKSQFTD